MAGVEPTPSTTMHHDAVSEVDSATAEHVVTVSILGSGGNDSTVVASNLAMESREQSRPKNAEDATKLDVIIAAPDSREQVSQLCKICKGGKTGDEDPLLCLGCSCPSDLRPAHRSCVKDAFGRGVKGGEHFCRLCRDVFRHHKSKVAVGVNSGDDDNKSGIMNIQAKQVGFKEKRIHPTPPPPLSYHHVEMPPTLDVSNARKAEEAVALCKLDILEIIELSVLMVLAFLVFCALMFTLVYLLSTD